MSSNVPTWIFITNVSLDALVILTVPVYLIFMKHLIQCKKENIYSSAFVLILFANGKSWDSEQSHTVWGTSECETNRSPVKTSFLITSKYQENTRTFTYVNTNNRFQKTLPKFLRVKLHFFVGFWDMFSSIIYLLFNELPQQGIFVEFYTVNPLWKARTSKAVEFGVRFFQLMSVVIVAVNRFFAVKRPLTYSRVFSSRRTKYIYITLYICTFLYMAPILFVADATVSLTRDLVRLLKTEIN